MGVRDRSFRPYVALTLAAVVCLAPFAGKAFHIDEPLFLWTARHIRREPLDFYHFAVNWDISAVPMAQAMMNPPLAGYAISLAALVFGWGETPLHLAFLVWAVGALWGTYRLAGRWTTRPLGAALAALFTPVFLISGGSVMCDMMMVCLWVWALVAWEHGLETGRVVFAVIAGFLIAACALTKYFGVSLIPLLLVYTLVRRRRPGAWVVGLLIPVAVLAAYQVWTAALYGRGLLGGAAGFAASFRRESGPGMAGNFLTGLAFVGGCAASAFFYVPFLWSRRQLLGGLALFVLLGMLLAVRQPVLGDALRDAGGVRTGVLVPLVLFVTAGVALLALAAAEFAAARDAGALLLLLWVGGTFAFESFLNWAVNARTVLPLVPAAGILVMRRLDRRPDGSGRHAAVVYGPLVPAAVLALLVARADFDLANSARTAAQDITSRYRGEAGKIWFEGHWGFQYYMRDAGARAMDFRRPPPRGAVRILVLPVNNYAVLSLDPNSRYAISQRLVERTDVLEYEACPWLATMNEAVSAGFYLALQGNPLPYRFGPVPREKYFVVKMAPPDGSQSNLRTWRGDGVMRAPATNLSRRLPPRGRHRPWERIAMFPPRMLPVLGLVLAGVWVSRPTATAGADERPLPRAIDFNRDVRPILSENCYACHGPDKNKRKAHLRLDTRDGLFTAARGAAPVVPGRPGDSELYRRVTAADPAERMPEPKSGKSLSPRQLAVLRRWIEQGAPWKGHWAYLPPQHPAAPAVENAHSARNPVDAFLLAGVQGAGLHPAPQADRVTLIRRLSFDLVGLPPAPADVDAFVQDPRPDAYERLVDRLLASPHYGERMAEYWLDLVRYADSIGYHSDNPMPVAPYRDYVIRAFNANMPFDRFTVEQLAGDLLPGATREQRVASAYNRLLQTTEEGGAQPKEYEAKYAADRVRNVSTVWLGTTMGCCQCHDHKFDPFTTRDFYRLAAFFADIREAAVGRREPGMPVPDAYQEAELGRLEARIAALNQELATATPALARAQAAWEARLGAATAAALLLPGRLTAAVLLGAPALPPEVRAALAVPAGRRSRRQREALAAHYRRIAPLLAPVRAELARQEKRKAALLEAVPKTLVAMAGPPRVVRILPRGNWMDESGEVVQPAIPATFGALRVRGRATRLDLARWLVAPDNPLTARVFVNRVWKLFFGQGLCKTLEDLGSQGDWPANPELLDWLAVEFRAGGWDVKRLVRRLVTSDAYRRSSRGDAELLARDPDNRLFARQARFRLDAEIVRDNALAVSGLLVERIGGPSVKPYQPAGYWDALNFPPRVYHADHGDRQYRRGLYTHWQRSFLHPSLQAFDAPTREECTAERPRSNLPQQALVLLDDPTYVEAARVFAERIIREGGGGVHARLHWAFRQALSRAPAPAEEHVLTDLLVQHSRAYGADREAARRLVRVGDWRPAVGVDPAELAAWTSVARVILNLHETITRD